jgi:hypothetical protein
MDDMDHWSAALWVNAGHIERWLRELWPSWRRDDIRSDSTEDGTWYWVCPDFTVGRSRVLGIERQLLERTPVSVLREALEANRWLDLIKDTPIRVARDGNGTWLITRWEPVVAEKWFPDPRGGYFVACEDPGIVVSTGSAAREARSFIALHGAGWSALGPSGNRPVSSYDATELIRFLPNSANQAP